MSVYYVASLNLDHLQTLLELDQICYGGYWGLQSYQAELQRSSSVVLGCFQSDLQTLIGFGILWLVLNEAHIISLAVHPQHRRQGAGRLLLTHLLKKGVDWECEWATLEVRASNQPARCLYEAVGFTQLGQRKHYYSNPREDALIYWKKL